MINRRHLTVLDEKIEPAWEFADSMCLLPPILTLPPEKSLEYFMTIAQTFYT